MKIRQGFVSNSSSSSFIAIAQKINLEDITKEIISSYDIRTFGKELYDGNDMIKIDNEITLMYFKLFPIIEDYEQPFTFYNIIKSTFDDDMDFRKSELLDEEYTIINYNVDHHTSSNLILLYERYQDRHEIDEQKLILELKNLYREKKLERIIKLK